MENIILNIVNIIVQCSITTYFLIKLASITEDKSYSKNRIFTVIMLIFIGMIFTFVMKNVFLITNVFINSLLPMLTLIISLVIILRINIIRAIFIYLSIFLTFAITESISALFLMLIFKIDANYIYNSMKLILLLILLQSVLNFFIILIISNILENWKNYKIMLASINSKQIINFILILIPCILPQIFMTIYNYYDYPVSFLIVNSVQMIIVTLTLFTFFKMTVERDKTQSDLITSEIHNKTMVGMVDGVRTLKHDYNNIIQALNGYVSTKQYDKLQDHINNVLKECNIVNNLSMIDPNVFNEPAIYGIVGAKYFLASEADITFDIDVMTDLREINFPKPELSRILGILLDNAIEATNKVDNKYIRLEMKFDNRKCADIIRVVNTYDNNIDINLTEIYKKGVSSKQEKSGIGLWEVKKIVTKIRHSQVYATIEGNKFVQNLIIEKT